MFNQYTTSGSKGYSSKINTSRNFNDPYLSNVNKEQFLQLQAENRKLKQEIAKTKKILIPNFVAIEFQDLSLNEQVTLGFENVIEQSKQISSESQKNFKQIKRKYDKIEKEKKQYQELIVKHEQEITEIRNYFIENYYNKIDPNLPLIDLVTQATIVKIKEEENAKEITNDKLLQENEKLKKSYSSLDEKYNDLKGKNHHNYVLIGNMKNLIIKKLNLRGEEAKLGGVQLTELAFKKKEEEISTLKKENETNKRRIEQVKRNLIKRTSNQSKYQNSPIETILDEILSTKDDEIETLKQQIEENKYKTTNRYDSDYLLYSQSSQLSSKYQEISIKKKLEEKGLIDNEYSTDPLETIIEKSLNKLEKEISQMKEQNQKIEEQIKKYAKDKYQNKNLPIYDIIDQIFSEQNSQIQNLNKQIGEKLYNNQEETTIKNIQTFFDSKYEIISEELNSIKIENAELKRTLKEIETIKQELIEKKSDNYFNKEESASMIIQKSLIEKDHQIELMQTKNEELKKQNDYLKNEIISKNQNLENNISEILKEKLLETDQQADHNKIEQLEQLLIKNNQLLNDVQERLQKPSDQTGKEGEELKKQNDEIQALNEEISQLRNKLNDANRKEESLNTEIARLKKNIEIEINNKLSAEDLMRRHIVIIQTENDRQLERLNYMHKKEIEEILNNQQQQNQ